MVNGCRVKLNGNTEFRFRSACSLDAPQMKPLQSFGGSPAFWRIVLEGKGIALLK